MKIDPSGFRYDPWNVWCGGCCLEYAGDRWKNGIERQVPISLDEDEQKQLQKSAQILKEMAEQVL